jgi:hypothetical protein
MIRRAEHAARMRVLGNDAIFLLENLKETSHKDTLSLNKMMILK